MIQYHTTEQCPIQPVIRICKRHRRLHPLQSNTELFLWIIVERKKKVIILFALFLLTGLRTLCSKIICLPSFQDCYRLTLKFTKSQDNENSRDVTLNKFARSAKFVFTTYLLLFCTNLILHKKYT